MYSLSTGCDNLHRSCILSASIVVVSVLLEKVEEPVSLSRMEVLEVLFGFLSSVSFTTLLKFPQLDGGEKSWRTAKW